MNSKNVVNATSPLASVFIDDILMDQSPCLGPGEDPWPVSVAIEEGASRIRLTIRDGYDNMPFAVVDWVNAGFQVTPGDGATERQDKA